MKLARAEVVKATAAMAITTQTINDLTVPAADPLIIADRTARGIVDRRKGRTHILSNAT
jgi:hypothetical protein